MGCSHSLEGVDAHHHNTVLPVKAHLRSAFAPAPEHEARHSPTTGKPVIAVKYDCAIVHCHSGTSWAHALQDELEAVHGLSVWSPLLRQRASPNSGMFRVSYTQRGEIRPCRRDGPVSSGPSRPAHLTLDQGELSTALQSCSLGVLLLVSAGATWDEGMLACLRHPRLREAELGLVLLHLPESCPAPNLADWPADVQQLLNTRTPPSLIFISVYAAFGASRALASLQARREAEGGARPARVSGSGSRIATASIELKRQQQAALQAGSGTTLPRPSPAPSFTHYNPQVLGGHGPPTGWTATTASPDLSTTTAGSPAASASPATTQLYTGTRPGPGQGPGGSSLHLLRAGSAPIPVLAQGLGLGGSYYPSMTGNGAGPGGSPTPPTASYSSLAGVAGADAASCSDQSGRKDPPSTGLGSPCTTGLAPSRSPSLTGSLAVFAGGPRPAGEPGAGAGAQEGAGLAAGCGPGGVLSTMLAAEHPWLAMQQQLAACRRLVSSSHPHSNTHSPDLQPRGDLGGVQPPQPPAVSPSLASVTKQPEVPEKPSPLGLAASRAEADLNPSAPPPAAAAAAAVAPAAAFSPSAPSPPAAGPAAAVAQGRVQEGPVPSAGENASAPRSSSGPGPAPALPPPPALMSGPAPASAPLPPPAGTPGLLGWVRQTVVIAVHSSRWRPVALAVAQALAPHYSVTLLDGCSHPGRGGAAAAGPKGPGGGLLADPGGPHGLMRGMVGVGLRPNPGQGLHSNLPSLPPLPPTLPSRSAAPSATAAPPDPLLLSQLPLAGLSPISTTPGAQPPPWARPYSLEQANTPQKQQGGQLLASAPNSARPLSPGLGVWPHQASPTQPGPRPLPWDSPPSPAPQTRTTTTLTLPTQELGPGLPPAALRPWAPHPARHTISDLPTESLPAQGNSAATHAGAVRGGRDDTSPALSPFATALPSGWGEGAGGEGAGLTSPLNPGRQLAASHLCLPDPQGEQGQAVGSARRATGPQAWPVLSPQQQQQQEEQQGGDLVASLKGPDPGQGWGQQQQQQQEPGRSQFKKTSFHRRSASLGHTAPSSLHSTWGAPSPRAPHILPPPPLPRPRSHAGQGAVGEGQQGQGQGQGVPVLVSQPKEAVRAAGRCSHYVLLISQASSQIHPQAVAELQAAQTAGAAVHLVSEAHFSLGRPELKAWQLSPELSNKLVAAWLQRLLYHPHQFEPLLVVLCSRLGPPLVQRPLSPSSRCSSSPPGIPHPHSPTPTTPEPGGLPQCKPLAHPGAPTPCCPTLLTTLPALEVMGTHLDGPSPDPAPLLPAPGTGPDPCPAEPCPARDRLSPTHTSVPADTSAQVEPIQARPEPIQAEQRDQGRNDRMAGHPMQCPVTPPAGPTPAIATPSSANPSPAASAPPPAGAAAAAALDLEARAGPPGITRGCVVQVLTPSLSSISGEVPHMVHPGARHQQGQGVQEVKEVKEVKENGLAALEKLGEEQQLPGGPDPASDPDLGQGLGARLEPLMGLVGDAGQAKGARTPQQTNHLPRASLKYMVVDQGQ